MERDWGWDTLGVAVAGVAYWLSERPAAPEITVHWFAERHSCDDVLYMAHMDFAA